MAEKKQNLVQGGIILTFAVVIVKIVGALYKLPLIALIGEDGFGYYSKAYSIYGVIYAIAVTGFPVAVSKLVAGYAAEGRYRDVKKMIQVANRAFLVLGVVSTLLLIALARPCAEYFVQTPKTYYAILAVAPSLLFSCLMSTHRGYNQGMQNMMPTAVSQVVEVLFKAGCGYLFAYIAQTHFTQEYLQFGTVLGGAMATEQDAHSMIAALGAAGSILGVSISTFAGWFYLVIRRWMRGDGVRKVDLLDSPKPHTARYQLKQLWIFVLPIALSAATASLTGLIDTGSLQDRLMSVVNNDAAALFASHGGVLELAEQTLENIPNYLYGVYSMGITIFNLVPSLTGSFGMSALPHVAASWTTGDRVSLKQNIESTLRMIMLIAAPCGFGIAFLAGPVAWLLFGSKRPVGAELVVPMLALLGVAAIFVAVASPLNSLLQAIGKIKVPVILMVVGGVIKLASNYFLVAIPALNIKAAPIGNLLCYLFICVAGLAILCRATRIRLNVWGIFGKPMLAGALCGASAMLAYNLMERFASISTRIMTVGAICVAALVYLVALAALNALVKEDIYGLPGGKKIAKLLEKLRVLR